MGHDRRVDGALVAAAAAKAAQDPGTQELMRQLSDPVRLRLLYAVHAAPGHTVGELAEAVGITPNNATKALGQLTEAGLVHAITRGRSRHFELADDTVHDLLHQLGAPHSPLHPPH